MAREGTPLLNDRNHLRYDARKLFVICLPFLVVLCIPTLLEKQSKEVLLSSPSKEHSIRVLYQDWRGLAQEQEDVFSFVHTWSGSVVVGESEEAHIDPDALRIDIKQSSAQERNGPDGTKGPNGSGSKEGNGQSTGTLSDVARSLEQKYKVLLKGENWELGAANALLSQFEDLCADALAGDQSLSCALDEKIQWYLTKDPIADDVKVQESQILIAANAFDYAIPQKAVLNGTQGVVFSLRLQHAVMRAITNFGHKASVVNGILQRKFNSTLTVDVGYTKLTSETTYEDKGRFMKFKPRELMYMLEAWSQTPEHLHKVPGLRYVTRRQQGLNHPYYGSTTAVSWPTNLAESYQEYMDYSFNNDAYTSKHLFLHEKTHFLWGRVWSDSLKAAWYDVGRWKEDTTNQAWMTESSTAFVSDYGAGNNPNEDMAEDLAAYVLHPRLLLARAPEKHAFISNRIMKGQRFLERAPHSAQLDSAAPLYRYPPTIKKISIRVSGKPEEEKQVEVEMVLAGAKGWLNPVHVDLSLSGPSSGSVSLSLRPKEEPAASSSAASPSAVGAEEGAKGAEEGEVRLYAQERLSQFLERGFWSARQITVEDGRGKQRWIMVDDYSWRLYLNNAKGTTWAPRYLKETLKLSVTREKDSASARDVPVVTATVRYQQTGAPLPAQTPIWMRLAAHGAPSDGVVVEGGTLTSSQWSAGSGAAEDAYPIYQTGTCVADRPGYSYEGTCTVTWKLSPYSAAGYYYIPMLSLKDDAANARNQFFTVQKPGWTCCGVSGNLDNDETPTMVALPACAGPVTSASTAPGVAVCVEPDTTPPELDTSSISISAVSPAADGSSGGAITASFRARDDKSGVGTVRYRIMDPQGFSHDGYAEHADSYGPVFTSGDPTDWRTYSIRLELPSGSPPGAWQLETIQLHDKAANRRAFQLIELLHFRPDHVPAAASSHNYPSSLAYTLRPGPRPAARQPRVRDVPFDVEPAWPLHRQSRRESEAGVPLALS